MIVTYEVYKGRLLKGTLLATFPTQAMADCAVGRVRVVEEDNPKGYRGVYTVARVETEKRNGDIVRHRFPVREHIRPRSDIKLAILRLIGACHDRNPEPAASVPSAPVQRPDDVQSLRAFLGRERSIAAGLPIHADAGA